MTEMDFKAIGQKIKERRLAQGITQEVVANHLNVNPSHISNIECGRAHASLSALIRIANVLECSVDCFIDGEYTYDSSNNKENTINDLIIDKLKYCDDDKKYRILKMIDLL